MNRVLVLGAGRIGGAVAAFLALPGRYEVHIGDRDQDATAHAARYGVGASKDDHHVVRHLIDINRQGQLESLLRQGAFEAVVSALPYHCNPTVATIACKVGCHYFDLSEDIGNAARIATLSRDAPGALVPMCGLAPGLVNIVAAGLAARLDRLDRLHLRVGALPLHPTNALKYSISWSVEGLVNEYLNDCECIVDGRRCFVPSLDGLEDIDVDGVSYEAFHTSGGIGTLVASLGKGALAVDYKTIRYPGHRDRMRPLLSGVRNDVERRRVCRMLEQALPESGDDVVVLRISARGLRDGIEAEESFSARIGPAWVAGKRWSAIQLATATGACAVIDTILSDPSRGRGLIAQESVPLGSLFETSYWHLIRRAQLPQRAANAGTGLGWAPAAIAELSA